MRRAIVSGIASHVGAVLGKQLTAAGFEVHGLTKAELECTMLREGGDTSNIVIHEVDGHTQTVVSLFEEVQPDVVIHLAALDRSEHRPTDVTPFVIENILFGTQLLEAAKSVGCRSFITSGSHLQYREDARHRASNLYAATRTAFEEILTYFVHTFGISAVVLILCNVYSEMDPGSSLLAQMSKAYADGTPLSLSAGELWVDLVHVEDVAAAFMQSIRVLDYHRAEGVGLAHYSVSSGKEMNCPDLMAVFESFGFQKPDIAYCLPAVPTWLVRPWRGICVPGWTPRISIEDGVARLLARRAARTAVTEDA